MLQISYLQKLKISIGRLNLGCEKLEDILQIYFLTTSRRPNGSKAYDNLQDNEKSHPLGASSQLHSLPATLCK
jgi:hypothetical protein